jgi:GMP synthase-like glutamine amidotransferase
MTERVFERANQRRGARRALLIGNSDDLDSGWVGHRFREHGYAFNEFHRDRPEHWAEPVDLDALDLVVSLGSEWNVYATEWAEPVEAEAALLRRVVECDMPLLAICFGAQLLSHALGGTVERMTAPEIGWCDIDFDGGGENVPRGPWMEWHYDRFSVPDGFTQLAGRPSGPELIAGGRAVATQFHPEVTEAVVSRWLSMGGEEQLREQGGEPDELRTETRANAVVSRANSVALVDWFLGRVAPT